MNKFVIPKHLPKPRAKEGDIVVVITYDARRKLQGTPLYSVFTQRKVMEARLASETARKCKLLQWRYWLQSDDYIDGDYKHGRKYVYQQRDQHIVANLTTGEIFDQYTYDK